MRKWHKYKTLKKVRKETMDISKFVGKQVFIKNIIGNAYVWDVAEEADMSTNHRVFKLTPVGLSENKIYYVNQKGIQYLPDQDVIRDWCHDCIDYITEVTPDFIKLSNRVMSHSNTDNLTFFAFHLPFNRKSNYVRVHPSSRNV